MIDFDELNLFLVEVIRGITHECVHSEIHFTTLSRGNGEKSVLNYIDGISLEDYDYAFVRLLGTKIGVNITPIELFRSNLIELSTEQLVSKNLSDVMDFCRRDEEAALQTDLAFSMQTESKILH